MGLTKYFLIPLLAMTFQKDCTVKKITHDNGNVTSYINCGEENTSIVFIHAGGLDHQMWKDQITTFKNEFRVIAYDLRGHGASSFTNNEPYEINDLIAVLDAEEINKVHLIGCSLGAIIALDFTLNHPEKVDKLVLVSPGLIAFQEADPQFLDQMKDYVTSLQTGDTSAIITKLKKLNAIGAKDRPLADEMDQYLSNTLQSFVNSSGLIRPPRLKTVNPIEHLEGLGSSTLLIVGEWDHSYIKKNVTYLNNQLVKSRLVTLNRAGHLPNLEASEQFDEILKQFLNESK